MEGIEKKGSSLSTPVPPPLPVREQGFRAGVLSHWLNSLEQVGVLDCPGTGCLDRRSAPREMEGWVSG